MLAKQLFWALGSVLALLLPLFVIGLIILMSLKTSEQVNEFLGDYLPYILGFAVVAYGNAAGSIIAHDAIKKSDKGTKNG